MITCLFVDVIKSRKDLDSCLLPGAINLRCLRYSFLL